MLTLKTTDSFDPAQTFLCGQCFRWEPLDEKTFFGTVGSLAAKVSCPDPYTVCIDASGGDEEFWRSYLGLSFDYADVKKELSADSHLKPCIERGHGIRILRQDPWETTISFIISANNNIPRIKKIISKLCELYGDKTEFDGKTVFGFPSPERLAKLELDELAEIRAGFRDKYIHDAAKRIASGEIDLKKIAAADDAVAKTELMKIKGVGSKVADCILLFSLGRYSVFPLDVWTKRILAEVYGAEEKTLSEFIPARFGKYAGIAQQYLYYFYAVEKQSIAETNH